MAAQLQQKKFYTIGSQMALLLLPCPLSRSFSFPCFSHINCNGRDKDWNLTPHSFIHFVVRTYVDMQAWRLRQPYLEC